MTACPDPVRLVAASAGEDVVALAHAAGCPGCRRAMRDHLSLRELAAGLPAPALRRARRDGMAAELLARAESIEVAKPLPPALVVERRIGRIVAAIAIAGGALAAAAAIMVVVDQPPAPSLPAQLAVAPDDADRVAPVTAVVPDGYGPVRVATGTGIGTGIGADAAAAVTAAGATASGARGGAHGRTASVIAATDARFDRHADGAIDRIALRDGTVTIEASAATAPVVVSGKNVKVRTGSARLAARADGGVVRQVQVFAGSAEIQTASGVVVVTAGETWTWDDPAAAESTAQVSAFQAGWDALRAGDFATAATELERAEDDPGVGEDATYWAAIAWGRAGQTARAVDGLERFLTRFPHATRAGEAHLALARLASDPDVARAHLDAASRDPDPRVRAAAAAALGTN
jgi:hypothetical protein